MREIVLDTETTGLDSISGHRIVEIGCVELLNHVRTGENFHQYINPERGMPIEAFNIHGLSEKFLSTKPKFSEIVDDFINFISNSTLIIHNSSFDMGFLSSEFSRLARPVPENKVIDTVSLARRNFPGASASLDSLCKRFNVDNSNRDLHGALLDAHLLAVIYVELVGGRQQKLVLSKNRLKPHIGSKSKSLARPQRLHQPSLEEDAQHRKFIASLKDPLWFKIGTL